MVECLSSSQVMVSLCGFEAQVGLCADSSETGACLDSVSSSLSLCASAPTCALSLSLQNKLKKYIFTISLWENMHPPIPNPPYPPHTLISGSVSESLCLVVVSHTQRVGTPGLFFPGSSFIRASMGSSG